MVVALLFGMLVVCVGVCALAIRLSAVEYDGLDEPWLDRDGRDPGEVA